MKKLLVSPDNVYGLLEIEEIDELSEIGIFNSEMIGNLLEYCQNLNRGMKSSGSVLSVKVGSVTGKDGAKCLAVQPAHFEGCAWVVLAPMVVP